MRLFNRSAAAVLALLMLAPTGALASAPERIAARKTIVLGLHAPITGFAPIPSQSLGPASRIYWKWLRHQGRTINGHNVKVVLKNDNGNPSEAAKVCRRMVKEDGADVLAGVLHNAHGSVQSQVCARVAASLGVPYVSLGGTTPLVDNLSEYFAISMTFRAQGRSLANYFIEKMKGRSRRNGFVSFDTPHHREATNAFRRRLEARKGESTVERLIARTAGASEAQAVATELNAAGVQNVFVFTTPTFFVQLRQAADNQNFHPRWASLGITMTHDDDYLGIQCGGSGPFRGRFFSPIPAFQDRDRYDKNFDRAAAELYPGTKNEIMWQGWATAKQIAAMLRKAGRRFTTRNFIDGVEGAGRLGSGIMPGVRFTKKDHFGASSTHVLFPRCSDERWHTKANRYH